MKKHIALTIAFLMLVTTLSLNAKGVELGQITTEEIGEEHEEVTTAVFSEQYTSWDEIEQNSDLVIYGRVKAQRTQLRVNMVFTLSEIEVVSLVNGEITSSKIEVLQTGGTQGGIETKPFSGTEILEIGEERLFFLRKADEESIKMYGEYYLIIGGYQGVYELDLNEYEVNSISADTLSTFLEDVDIPIDMVELDPNARFYKNQDIKVEIQNVHPNNYETFWGIAAWSFFVGEDVVSFTEIPEGAVIFDIRCVNARYGDTGWYGEANMFYQGNTSIIESATICLNISLLGTDWGERPCAVAIHETGHALGIPHPDNIDQYYALDENQNKYFTNVAPFTESIMSAVNFFKYMPDPSIYDGCVYSIPQQHDIDTIIAKFESMIYGE